MPEVNVKLNVIRWAYNQSDEKILGEKLVKHIKEWLDGVKLPTFNQIQEFSKKSHIPLGYFFLKEPPVEKIDLLSYRTIDSYKLEKPSRNLIDTIREMELIQEWMSDYRHFIEADELGIVGSMQNNNNYLEISRTIRKDLNLNKNWHTSCKDVTSAFNYLRNLLENIGIIVMVNSVVGNNNHRPLDINEFRAFVMVNKIAPLIFINGTDSKAARLFSLFHELAHIWIGISNLYNDTNNTLEGVNKVESICNAVAAELILPNDIFLIEWENNFNDHQEKIKKISMKYYCSEVVVARKALDNKKINYDDYISIVLNSIKNFNISKVKNTTGGDYYNTMKSRLDRIFVRALCDSVNTGRTSYTEAYRLTNTSSKTFAKVVEKFGGTLW